MLQKEKLKNMKSHFLYTKQQRSGILLLCTVILITQLSYHFIDFKDETTNILDPEESAIFQKQIDSLKKIRNSNTSLKIYPFNPNFIKDYKGYQLGMSTEEIDRLHQHRALGKYVNSTQDFQRVTKISDSLLHKISPYFKFPAWTQKKTPKKRNTKTHFNHEVKKDQTIISTRDLNSATLSDFLAIEGVEEALAERIINYRTKLQGFYVTDQIFEVWNLDETLGNRILKTFTIKTTPSIKKININTAHFKEILALPYIDYDLCKKIFDFRDEVAELQDISELKNIEGFPLNKYNRIVVYLSAE